MVNDGETHHTNTSNTRDTVEQKNKYYRRATRCDSTTWNIVITYCSGSCLRYRFRFFYGLLCWMGYTVETLVGYIYPHSRMSLVTSTNLTRSVLCCTATFKTFDTSDKYIHFTELAKHDKIPESRIFDQQ